MARRKPQRVERNRQQNQRQREAEQRASGADDAADEGASNDAPAVIEIDDYDERDASDDVEAETKTDPPPTKRRRVQMRRGMFNRRSWIQEEVELRVGDASTLWLEAAPWDASTRAGALWVSFPVDSSSLLWQRLRKMEEKGVLNECDVPQTIGLCVIGDEDAVDADAETLLVREVCDDWDWSTELLGTSGLISVEVVRIGSSEESVAGTYNWHVGIDWQRLMEAEDIGVSSARGFMMWALYQSKKSRSVANQWRYHYPKEIDALYRALHRAKDFPWNSELFTAFDVHDVYAKINVERHLQRDTSNIPAEILAPASPLLPALREYQKAALSWMLSREGVVREDVHATVGSGGLLGLLTGCVRFSLPTKSEGSSRHDELLFDIFSGRFEVVTEKTAEERRTTNLGDIRGGILADEMGLGKTVEVIALVLSNPSPLLVPDLLTDVSVSENVVEKSSFEKNCICGSEEECDPGWVQCDLCHLWHHQLCTGFDPEGAVPYSVSSSFSLSADSFMCFQCQVEQHVMLSCKTTLIVSPESIHDQWESELKRHVRPGTLRLLRYPGVRALRSKLQGEGPSAEWRLLASVGIEMASYDIVLTTYEALAYDLHHVPTVHGNERRLSTRQKRKKYAFIASPLVFLKFWRVCMDEAQVGVENTQLQAALTVAELSTEMQWIVTGTPFSTQLMDLYGCFKFLGLTPYCDEHGGKQAFQGRIEVCYTRGAVERLHDLLLSNGRESRNRGALLWRTSKKDVFDQLGLPSQSQELVWCRFSNVERLFYDKQEAEVVKALQTEQERRRMQMLDNEETEVSENVWHRVLLLRQVCCHPQVGQILSSIGALGRLDRRRAGRAGARGGGQNNGMQATMPVLTMDDFLQQLLVKCRRECEEAQRKLIAAHNGHASLALVGDDHATAIMKYLISVQLIRSNWNEFRADLLPRLHILDNLANSVRRAFRIETTASDDVAVNSIVGTREDGAVDVGEDQEPQVDGSNPKQVSLMPALPVLLGAITENGLVTDGVDAGAIARECATLEAAAHRIRSFYLSEVEFTHSSALHHFESVRDVMDSKLSRPKTRARGGDDDFSSPMLCSSSVWWLEMLGVLQQVGNGQPQVAHMVDRLRAHLYALGTKWSASFAGQFHNIRGLSLALVNELVTLRKRRDGVTEKLLTMSERVPSKTDIEVSGNCKKCRDARDGPVCWHCKFYRELEGYKQHMLGIDSTVAPASALPAWTADILDDQEEHDHDDDGVANAVSTTASTSLFLDIFRQLASGTRLILRENKSSFTAAEHQRLTKLLQEGMQTETEVWAQLLREWNRAKKLFQTQHQRLGALDELEMAQMKIRLRLPGEIVESATDKLYKLAPHELPLKKTSFEVERVVAETELKQKQSELRYLKHLQATKQTENGSSDASAAANTDDKTCVVCLEDMSKQRVAMLPCAHKTCMKCSNRLASRFRASRSIRCPTCRRIFGTDERKEVENDPERAKEVSLAARTANAQVSTPDASVQLLHSGFSSKIDAILRRVKALATKNPELKALVFTQWQDMMGVIAAALQLNGVKCFTYTSKKQFHRVLQEFKLFPDPCVLALPFKIGANGLNIIEATEVLLVEPLLNTSIEAQAINRVHRIGQTKPTRVHRFVVDDSVEERIHWLGRHHGMRSHGSTEREGKAEDDDSDGDAEMEGDDSVVVGRQEKEKLTIAQLQALLNGRAMLNFDDMVQGTTANGGDHPFWQQRVEMNGRVLTRREARELLERRHAAERRVAATTTATASEPTTLVVDRDVGLVTAHELLELKEAEGTEQPLVDGLAELVRMARLRISEELRVWRATPKEANVVVVA